MRSQKRPGYGPHRGSTNPKLTVSGIAPAYPSKNDIWIDDINALQYFWDSTEWELIGAITVQTTEPETGYDGQMLLKDKIGYPVSCIFSSYSTKTANTAAEVTIIPASFTGVQTLPANFLTVGKMLRIKLCGYLKGSASETLNIIFKLGTTAICATGATTTVNATNKFFEIEVILTCITTGATGTVWAQGRFLHNATVWEMVNTATDTIDTTATQLINVTATFNSVTNTPFVTVTNMTVELMRGDYRDDGWVYGVPMYYVPIATPSEKVYIYGGITGSTYLQDTDEYTPDTWTNKTDIPSPARNGLASSTINSKGYIYGGYNVSPGQLKDTDEYTPDTWTNKTDMPSPARNGLASSTINSKGYIYGGYNAGSLQDTDEYTPDTWVSKTNIPSPARHSLASSTIDSKGYIYGGLNSVTPSAVQDTDEYTPDTWASKTNIPSPVRHGHASSTIDSKGYIYGGIDEYLNVYQDTDEYTPDTWVSKTNIPSPARRFLASSTINSKGYIYGGFASSAIQDTDEYTPDTWTNKTDIPSPARNGLASSTI